jgi:two-component system C4-dicarboxylate transport sensor histidine kinase DctB
MCEIPHTEPPVCATLRTARLETDLPAALPFGLTSARARRWTVFLAVGALLLALTTWTAGRVAAEGARRELARQAANAAALHAAVLRSELEKHRSLPVVLAEDPDVRAALRTGDAAGVAALNAKLEALSGHTRAAVIYILGTDGVTIAASNWRRPDSFVGSDYSFRPYFSEGMRRGVAEYFALGTVSGRPGLFLSRRVESAGRAVGVVVVKVEFEVLEAEWRASGEPAFVSDANGIVLVSSVAPWRFRTLGQLPEAERRWLRAGQAFGDQPLSPLPIRVPDAGRPNEVEASLPGQRPARFVTAEAPTTTQGWTLHLLTPAGRAIGAAANAARSVALLLTALVLVGAGLLLRRRERAAAREAEQEAARAELEARVDARTAELRTANEHLVREMENRRRAQASLQTMQDELVQANKLATLGQIAAGVAHEINQPVAAIRTYADNASVMLDRADTEPVRRNLGIIATLTERIGVITDELRAFSRKTSGRPHPVAVDEAIDGALLLIGARAREQGVRIERDGASEGVVVMAERVRLEQVLVNLLQNALEAVAETPDPLIRLAVRTAGRKVRITVTDNGPGLSAETTASLFTPFVTTKTTGLGLGLVISRDIITEFGGELTAEAPAGGGAGFVIVLRKAA